MLTRETSKQRKTEALKDYKLLNLSVSLTWTVKIVLWMIMKVVPVIPPEYVLVPLDGGRLQLQI
jgi:DNA-directed RNA polymerase beta' subunit